MKQSVDALSLKDIQLGFFVGEVCIIILNDTVIYLFFSAKHFLRC